MRDEIKAGLTIIIAMAILTISVIFIGGSRLFDTFDIYYVKLYDVTGLETGSQVKLGGMRIGRVLSIIAPQKENDPIIIEIGLEKGTQLYEGVKASISQVGFVGDIFLQLYLGNANKNIIKPGSTIPSIEQSNFNTIMAKAEDLTVSLKKLVEDIDKVFTDKNINKISELLDNTNNLVVNTEKNLDTVIISLKYMSERLTSMIAKAEGMIDDNRDGIKEIVSKARDDLIALEKLIAHLEISAKTLNKTFNSADNLLQRQNQNLDELIENIILTIDNLNDAITEFNQKPWRLIYKDKRHKEE
ncbi:MAG: MlaD family protein [Thermodesulfovibrionales bacterium]|nr:MlaD family protein [Thermodesulfovibrionales bacterium]